MIQTSKTSLFRANLMREELNMESSEAPKSNTPLSLFQYSYWTLMSGATLFSLNYSHRLFPTIYQLITSNNFSSSYHRGIVTLRWWIVGGKTPAFSWRWLMALRAFLRLLATSSSTAPCWAMPTWTWDTPHQMPLSLSEWPQTRPQLPPMWWSPSMATAKVRLSNTYTLK